MQLSSGLSFLCAGIMSMHRHAQILLIVIHCYNNALITSRGRKTGFKRLDTGCGVVHLCSGPWGLSFNLPLSQLSQLGDGNNYPAQDSYASNRRTASSACWLTPSLATAPSPLPVKAGDRHKSPRSLCSQGHSEGIQQHSGGRHTFRGVVQRKAGYVNKLPDSTGETPWRSPSSLLGKSFFIGL